MKALCRTAALALPFLLCFFSLNLRAQCEAIQQQAAQCNEKNRALSEENDQLADNKKKLEKDNKRLKRDLSDCDEIRVRAENERDEAVAKINVVKAELSNQRALRRRELDSLRFRYTYIEDTITNLKFRNGELERLLRFQQQTLADLQKDMDQRLLEIDSLKGIVKDQVDLAEKVIYFKNKKIDFGQEVIFVRARSEDDKYVLDLASKKDDLRRFANLMKRNRYKVRIDIFYCCDRDYKSFGEQVKQFIEGVANELAPLINVEFKNQNDLNMGVYIILERT